MRQYSIYKNEEEEVRAKFSECLNVFNRAYSNMLFRTYMEMCEGLDAELVLQALDHVIQNCEFFPKPVVFKRILVQIIDKNSPKAHEKKYDELSEKENAKAKLLFKINGKINDIGRALILVDNVIPAPVDNFKDKQALDCYLEMRSKVIMTQEEIDIVNECLEELELLEDECPF